MYDLSKMFAAEMYLFGISVCYVCVVRSTLLNSVNVSGDRITLQVYVYFLFLSLIYIYNGGGAKYQF